MAVAMMMVMMAVVVRPSLGGHGEHRQHRGDGDQLGQGHGSFFLL
jgi:hypothetical protein